MVGGVAANAHGSARITFDLDICYDTSPDNIRALARILADWHAYLRGVEPGLPFVMDERAFRTTPVMTLTTDLGPINVKDLVSGVGDYTKAVASSTESDANGTTFRVLDLPALVSAKRAAGRKKDLEHLLELEALLALRKATGRGKGLLA